MAKLLNDYVSQDVELVWNGVPLDAPADTFVTVSFVEDQTLSSQSPDGSVARSLMPSTMGTIEVTLQQESPTHKALSAILNRQKATRVIQSGTFSIVNPNGFALYIGIDAHIQNPPELTYGKTHEDGVRTWVFHAAELKLLG